MDPSGKKPSVPVNNPGAIDSNSGKPGEITKKTIRERQDELLKLVFDENDLPENSTSGSYVTSIIISIVVAIIIAAILYLVITNYFKDQIDNTMLIGIISVVFLLTLLITFFLTKPKPQDDKKDKLCET